MNRRNFASVCGSMVLFPFVSGLGESKTEDVDLAKILHREFQSSEKVAKRNHGYLIDGLKQRKDVHQFEDLKTLRSDLETELKKIEHIDYEKRSRWNYSIAGFEYNGPKDIHILSPTQLARVHILFSALQDKDFRKKVFKEIKTDLEDPQVEKGFFASEYGGLGVLEKGIQTIHPILSVDATKKRSSVDKFGNKVTTISPGTNNTYRMPDGVIEKTPHTFGYHIHATEKNPRHPSPNPSLAIPETPSLVGYSGDIGHALCDIKIRGESHEVLFSKLKGDRFNCAYYGGERGSKNVVLSLGSWDV